MNKELADSEKIAMFNRSLVIADVLTEIGRQDALWGWQNWQSFDKGADYGIPSQVEAKSVLNERFADGVGSWADIFVEEVAEAFDEQGCVENLREELIQVAAVVIQWVSSIDRNEL